MKSSAMNLSGFWSPANRRGQILDLLVFLANLFLLGPFARLLGRLGAGFTANEDAAARKLALIILAAFVSYTLGAMLKRAPLHKRIKSLPSPGYAGCLFLGWVSLHLSLSILGAAVIAASFDALPKGVPLAAMILCSILPTFFVARVVFPPRTLEQIPAWRKSWLMELLADLLIIAAVILLTIMWDIWIGDLFTGTWKGQTFGDRLFGAGLAAGAFALFYLSPRFLFLIEDFNKKLTWATIGLTFVPLLSRILFGWPAK
jgi:hypothetical protein